MRGSDGRDRTDLTRSVDAQQSRILSDPAQLFGPQLLSLLVQLIQDGGAALELRADERLGAMALAGRWDDLEKRLAQFIRELSESSGQSKAVNEPGGRTRAFLVA